MTEDLIFGGPAVVLAQKKGEGPVSHNARSGGPLDSGKEPMQPLVRFTGSGWELFKLYIGNYLLSILTLGVYSFWAKAAVRRYLWGNIELFDETLEYTGTGGELFRGFLLALLLGGILLAVLYASSLLVPIFGAVLLSVILIPVKHFASYQALRYRLTRTRWCGIRGNMSGSSIAYAMRGSGYTLLSLLTLFLCVPLETARLTSRRLNAAFFGSRWASFSGTSRPLFVRWVWSYILLILLAAVGIIALFALRDKGLGTIHDAPLHAGQSVFFLLLLVGGGLFGISSVIYRAAVVRWMFAHLTFGAMRFDAKAYTAWGLLRLRVVNGILLLLTLGLAYPWTEIRSLRFFLSAVRYTGDPDIRGLLQDTLPANVRSEGLLDALDVDISL